VLLIILLCVDVVYVSNMFENFFCEYQSVLNKMVHDMACCYAVLALYDHKGGEMIFNAGMNFS
jgi:hypothetical protein